MSEESDGARRDALDGRVLLAALAVFVAALVVVVSSVDVYLIEDGSHLASLAYQAAPLLNVTYAAIYTTALGVGVLAIVAAGRLAVAWWGATTTTAPQATPLVVLLVAAVALAGLWGLAIRHPLAFVILVTTLATFVTVALLAGRAVVARWSSVPAAGSPAGSALAACVAAALGMAINVALAVAHTVALRVSGAGLYATTIVHLASVPLSELAIGSALATIFTLVAVVLVTRAVLARGPTPG